MHLPTWHFPHHPPPLQRPHHVCGRWFPTAWDLEICINPASSQASLKRQINVYIAHHIWGQCNSPISTQTEKNVLLGQLFLSRDMSNSYRSFLSDNKPPPKHVIMTPLPLSLINTFFDESIQASVTKSSISSNTYTQWGVSFFWFAGRVSEIMLKTFATSDMEDSKDISSGNIINFNDLTKRYANSYFTPQSDNGGNNSLRLIYEIENVVSEY